jgi:hypothetical protein
VRLRAGPGGGGDGWAAASVGWAGVAPAAVHVQVRQLQPLLPGARLRPAGGARHHRVLPGGVALQVPEPALHAVISSPATRGGWALGDQEQGRMVA